ncbi:hypothetical protein ACLOJK_039080 [Asimina triloba]
MMELCCPIQSATVQIFLPCLSVELCSRFIFLPDLGLGAVMIDWILKMCCWISRSGFGAVVAHRPMPSMMLPWPPKMEKMRTGRKKTDTVMIGDEDEALLFVVDHACCH